MNIRVNYPIKESFIRMMENGDISMNDQMCRFSVSWYTLRVANIGIGLLISSWNEHPIPSKHKLYYTRSGFIQGVELEGGGLSIPNPAQNCAYTMHCYVHIFQSSRCRSQKL